MAHFRCLRFGEGVVQCSIRVRGKAYFFFNYERFHLNETSPVRQRQVLTAEAQNGIFRYGPTAANTSTCSIIAAAKGLPNTIDPTVHEHAQHHPHRQRQSRAHSSHSEQAVSCSGSRSLLRMTASSDAGSSCSAWTATSRRTTQIEGIFNDQPFRSNVDFLNNVDPAFPGIANAGTQNSDRRSLSIGVRSSFGSSVVNEFRYAQLAGWLGGNSRFDLVGGTDFCTKLMHGYNIALAAAGLTNLDDPKRLQCPKFADSGLH